MEELRKLIEELENRQHSLDEERCEVYNKLEEAKDKLFLEQSKDIEKYIPAYTKKLNRIKSFIQGLEEDDVSNETVRYTFLKIEEPYRGDCHEIIQDPLDYVIGEYDCLGMTKFMEIVFEYHNEVVKNFVDKWMKENMEFAEFYDDVSKLYNKNLRRMKSSYD